MKLAVTIIALAASCASASVQSNYFVGNSLTYNEVYNFVGDKIDMFAQFRGNSHQVGYHWIGGQSLSSIVSSWEMNHYASSYSPSDYQTRTPQGGLNNLVLQASLGSANSEAAAMVHIANLLPGSDPTKLYLYATWPSRPMDYLPTWEAPYPDPSVAPDWAPSAAYFSRMLSSLRAAEPNRKVFMIPAGEVLAEIQRRINVGTFTGLNSADDLYGDDLHMSFEGMYTIGMTMYATLFKDDPRGIGIPAMFQSYVSPALAAQIENVVHDVVWANPAVSLTVPGDCNIDSVVNFEDLFTVAQHYGTTSGATWAQGDFNLDAKVNFTDLFELAQYYRLNPLTDLSQVDSQFAADWATAQSLVPEPTIAGSLLMWIAPLSRRRRI